MEGMKDPERHRGGYSTGAIHGLPLCSGYLLERPYQPQPMCSGKYTDMPTTMVPSTAWPWPRRAR